MKIDGVLTLEQTFTISFKNLPQMDRISSGFNFTVVRILMVTRGFNFAVLSNAKNLSTLGILKAKGSARKSEQHF